MGTNPSSLPRFIGALLILTAAIMASPVAATTFTTSCYDTLASPAVAVADFNGDGNLDAAITPSTTYSGGAAFTIQPLINVYLGNGTGGFTFSGQLNTAAAFLDMVAVDVNNDGKVDLVASGDPVSILKGNGDGTFQVAQTAPGGINVALGDLNGDGFADLVVGNGKNVIVSFNQGNGAFGAGTIYKMQQPTRGITVQDVNGDGLRDIGVLTLASNQNSGNVSVLINRGSGTFARAMDSKVNGFVARNLRFADFNGDGKLDVALGRYLGGGAAVLIGNGSGSFGSQTNYAMAGNTIHVDLGDMNGDGKTDILAGNFAAKPPDGTVSVLYGNGSGGFSIGNVIPAEYGLGVAAADVNHDSRVDILEDTCVLLNNGPVASAVSGALTGFARPSEPAAGTKLGFSPNPVHDRGAVSFHLAKEGKVSIHLYDIRGRRVQTLADGAWMTAGAHSVAFDRRATGLDAGVYFYRVEAEGSRMSGSIVVMDR